MTEQILAPETDVNCPYCRKLVLDGESEDPTDGAESCEHLIAVDLDPEGAVETDFSKADHLIHIEIPAPSGQRLMSFGFRAR